MVVIRVDRKIFVQNVKQYCFVRGIKPTVACRESGAGPNLLGNIEAGSIPSVEKVQLLAQYLGVSTSELLGERPSDAPKFPEHPYLVLRYDLLSEEDQQDVMDFIEYKVAQAAKKEAKKRGEETDGK